jgi:hypothetical protein
LLFNAVRTATGTDGQFLIAPQDEFLEHFPTFLASVFEDWHSGSVQDEAPGFLLP